MKTDSCCSPSAPLPRSLAFALSRVFRSQGRSWSRKANQDHFTGMFVEESFPDRTPLTISGACGGGGGVSFTHLDICFVQRRRSSSGIKILAWPLTMLVCFCQEMECVCLSCVWKFMPGFMTAQVRGQMRSLRGFRCWTHFLFCLFLCVW